MTRRILFVDDEVAVLSGLARNLRGRFDFLTTPDPSAALKMAVEGEGFAVIVTDMQMPVMNGLRLLEEVRKVAPNTVRLMLTGNSDQETAIAAINRGQIFSFLRKPAPIEDLAAALASAIRQYELITAEKELLERTLAGAVRTLVEVLSAVQPRVFNRALKIRELALSLAAKLPVSIWALDMAAMLSAIGWVAIPSDVAARWANKESDGVTDADRQLVDQVPAIGGKLLGNIPRLESVTQIVRYQNKNFDGSGVPGDDIAGEHIPAEARLLHICHDMIHLSSQIDTLPGLMGRLRERKGSYDPAMLSVVEAALNDRGGLNRGTDGASVKVERVTAFKPADMLLEDLAFADGELALARHETLNQVLIERFLATHEVRPLSFPIRVSRPEKR